MEMNFCRRCGTPLTHKAGPVYACDSGHTIFADSSPASGAFIMTDDDSHVLLSVRGIEPHKGMLDAFGGFVDGEETFEQALERELREELGLESGDYETPKYLTSGVGLYDFDNETRPVLGGLFWTRLKDGAEPKAADDVAEIVKISIADLDPEVLHDEVARQGARVIKQIFGTSQP